MPKTNKPVLSKTNQQRVRRMKEREVAFQQQFDEAGIECCSLERLYRASPDEIKALIPIMKKLVQHNKKVNDLIMNKSFSFGATTSDEINQELLNHLATKYKGVKGKELKYKHQDRKDKFREIVIKDNQDIFNNCLKIEAENTIKTLYVSIDVNDFDPPTRYYDREAKLESDSMPVINMHVQPEIVKIDAPLPPKVNMSCVVVNPREKTPQEKAPPVKATPVKTPPVKTTLLDDADSSSDEDDLEAFEQKNDVLVNTDKDETHSLDLKTYANSIKKIIKGNMKERINTYLLNIDDANNEYEHLEEDNHGYIEHVETPQDIIECFALHFKRPKRGSKKELYKWTIRNPTATKKIISKMYKSIERTIRKDTAEENKRDY